MPKLMKDKIIKKLTKNRFTRSKLQLNEKGKANLSLIVYLKHKAIPIKCFVAHRPTDAFFWKSKKKIQNHL